MARLLRSAILMACFFTAGTAFAGGTCPSGIPVTGNNCYFIAANGADTNTGTDEQHPWLHAPGMPTCASNCAATKPAPGNGFIFRGGDTWHFGNSGLAPYTGGTWSVNQWAGTDTSCMYEGTQTGCVYFGVDQTWFTGTSWARPILTADNPLSSCTASGNCAKVASCSFQVGTNNVMIYEGADQILDNFEITGLCSSRNPADTNPAKDIMISLAGPQSNLMQYLTNLYFHGWTVTTTAGQSNNSQPCTLIGNGVGTLETFDHLVIDGSDSLATACAYGTFPQLYHFRDSIIRFASQGVVGHCHDIHDVIWEHMFNALWPTHANTMECNDDATGSAGNQPANTPNVFYNNIARHDDPNYPGGNPRWWFCPNNMPEYQFNNIQYDLVPGSENWAFAGPPGYPSCTNAGGQFMFNNTIVDAIQACHNGGSNQTGGSYLTVLNEHLINTRYDSSAGGCTGFNSPTNLAQTDAQATAQGYTSGSPGNSAANNCANDVTPCAATSSGGATVNAGSNLQAYCNTLASFTSEYAIGTEAANACRLGTTDGCTYITSTHSVSCTGNTAVMRPSTGAWDVGAYQGVSSQTQGPHAPSNLTVTVQ